MDEKESNSLPTTNNESKDLKSIAQNKQNEVLAKLVEEEDLDKIKDLTHLFNVNQTKRNALRVNTLNDVQDALVNQMLERLSKHPDNFDNRDIADWMKTIQMVIDNNSKSVAQVDDIPTITSQQNTQVNINIVDSMSRESRERIMEVIEQLKNGVLEDGIDDENDVIVEDITEENENKEGGAEDAE